MENHRFLTDHLDRWSVCLYCMYLHTCMYLKPKLWHPCFSALKNTSVVEGQRIKSEIYGCLFRGNLKYTYQQVHMTSYTTSESHIHRKPALQGTSYFGRPLTTTCQKFAASEGDNGWGSTYQAIQCVTFLSLSWVGPLSNLWKGCKNPHPKKWSPAELPGIPPKFNIAPEKLWLEDYFPFGKAYFQGLC